MNINSRNFFVVSLWNDNFYFRRRWSYENFETTCWNLRNFHFKDQLLLWLFSRAFSRPADLEDRFQEILRRKKMKIERQIASWERRVRSTITYCVDDTLHAPREHASASILATFVWVVGHWQTKLAPTMPVHLRPRNRPIHLTQKYDSAMSFVG